MPRRLIWQIFPPFLLVTVLSLAAVSWYTTLSIREYYVEDLETVLASRAKLIRERLKPYLDGDAESSAIDSLSKLMGRETDTRITVVNRNGDVIGDSHDLPRNLDNQGDRPEIREALANELGIRIRYSFTAEKQMMYVALPAGEGPGGYVIRTALPISSIDTVLHKIRNEIFRGGAAVALLAVLMSLGLAHRISRPIQELRRGAERFASGDLSTKIYPNASGEIRSLADTLNHMAEELRERLDRITVINSEQEAILSSMREAVVAVDHQERIIILNRAAVSLFRIDSRKDPKGRLASEVVRRHGLLSFLRSLLESGESRQQEITMEIMGQEARYLQLSGVQMRHEDGRSWGVLVVANDITRMKRLENMRKDFVANVSHELRTPLTSIKGFVETLLEGSYQDPEQGRRFLEIIAKHADRLNTIIEDLLTLSKIERDLEDSVAVTDHVVVAGVAEKAVEMCRSKASLKNIRIHSRGEPELKAWVNPSLMEQALINLIDNAIKYSDEGKSVEVRYESQEGACLFTVQDEGMGIPSEHLPRLFERFYRVDKARSRSMGGTGLGLAIVKHIVRAHNGTVWVESKVGVGSRFYIRIPETVRS